MGGDKLTRILSTVQAKLAVTAVAVATLALPTDARSATIIFDQLGEQGGTLTEAGGEFVGTNIVFEVIFFDDGSGGSAEGTAYCGSSLTIGTGTDTNCYLNFDTSTGMFEVTAPDGLWDNTGAGGGPGALIPGTVGSILTGTGFDSYGFSDSPTNLKFGATGTDTKLAELLEYFGVSGDWIFSNTEIRTSDGVVTQADITNTNTPVPEPGLMALFGLGLLGIGRQVARRRK
jgi:hypothetical protein